MSTIKVKAGFRRFSPELVLTTSMHVSAHIYGNNDFTPPQAQVPPIDQATLEAANDRLSASIAASYDGSSQAIAQRNEAKEVVVKLLEQLATYAQTNCKDNMNTLMSSGFTPISSTRTIPPPICESIRKMASGANSGQMDVTLMTYPGAASYELRWGAAQAGGVPPTSWTSMPIVKLRPATTISNLAPGTAYVFQARAVVHGGYSDWGDPITRFAV
jgi:hypothetical protein